MGRATAVDSRSILMGTHLYCSRGHGQTKTKDPLKPLKPKVTATLNIASLSRQSLNIVRFAKIEIRLSEEFIKVTHRCTHGWMDRATS